MYLPVNFQGDIGNIDQNRALYHTLQIALLSKGRNEAHYDPCIQKDGEIKAYYDSTRIKKEGTRVKSDQGKQNQPSKTNGSRILKENNEPPRSFLKGLQLDHLDENISNGNH